MHDEQTKTQMACDHCHDSRSYRISVCGAEHPALLLYADVRTADCTNHGIPVDRGIPAYTQPKKVSGAAVHVRRYLVANLLSFSAWKNAGERSRISAALECDVYAGAWLPCYDAVRFNEDLDFAVPDSARCADRACSLRRLVVSDSVMDDHFLLLL